MWFMALNRGLKPTQQSARTRLLQAAITDAVHLGELRWGSLGPPATLTVAPTGPAMWRLLDRANAGGSNL